MDLRRYHLKQRRFAGPIGTDHDPTVGLVNLPGDLADQGGAVPDDAHASQIDDSCHGFSLQFLELLPADYRRAMDSLPSVRMTANLNSMIRGQQSIEQAERAIVGGDVAHHVIDPESVLGLDPFEASILDDTLEALLTVEQDGWFLALPLPGSLAPLRGPAAFNLAAVEQGEAVVASSAGIGLVPIRVGQAVQWQIFNAEPPRAPSSPSEAERALNEVVIDAAATLSRLDVASGTWPEPPAAAALPPGYTSRQRATVQRAARLLAACDAALLNDGASISS